MKWMKMIQCQNNNQAIYPFIGISCLPKSRLKSKITIMINFLNGVSLITSTSFLRAEPKNGKK